MGILDQIAQPQMADIAGALDIRQKRLDADENKRKEIRMGQLIAEALPNIRKGSPLHEMATNDPKHFMLFTKAMGIPLNAGDQLQEMTDDVSTLYTMAQGDPRAAYEHAIKVKQDRNASGRDTPQLDKWIGGMEEDPQKAMTALFVMHRSINPQKASEGFTLGDTRYDANGKVIATNPRGTGAAGSSEDSMHIKNLREYKRLKSAGDPEAEPFAQMVNLKSREGKELTSDVTKILNDLTEENKVANYNVNRYTGLAKKIRNADYDAGVKGKSVEAVKNFFGSQDETTSLKKELALIRNSEALKSLPAGSASEKDVEMVMEPMPDQNSDPTFVANWLDAYAKVSSGIAKYTEAKADFIAKHGSVRDKDGNTFIKSWKEQGASQTKEAQTGKQEKTSSGSMEEKQKRLQELRANQKF